MFKKISIISALILLASLFAQAKDGITYKELLVAKELYEKGSIEKAKSIIEILKNDKDKKLAEQAYFLKFKLFNDIFVPSVDQSSTDSLNQITYTSALSKDFTKFKKSFPKSKFIPEIDKILNGSGKTFSEEVKNNKNNVLVNLADSCSIQYKTDSTFVLSFEQLFTDSTKKEHLIKISFAGKLVRYEPYGDMKDEWGSTGLLLNTNGNISIELDSLKTISYPSPVVIKQYPEYVLRTVTEYGFTQDKTFIREDNVEQKTEIASSLNERFLISNFNLKLIMGKMHELVPYYSDNPENTFPNNFKSKAYLSINVISR